METSFARQNTIGPRIKAAGLRGREPAGERACYPLPEV